MSTSHGATAKKIVSRHSSPKTLKPPARKADALPPPKPREWVGPAAGIFDPHHGDPESCAKVAAGLYPLTSFLWYKNMRVDSATMMQHVGSIRKKVGNIPIQIGYEPGKIDSRRGLTIEEVAAGLRNPDSSLYQGVAGHAAVLRDQGIIYLRPMSEMNMPDAKNSWGVHSLAQADSYVSAWHSLHAIFDKADATNCLFLLDFAQNSGSSERTGGAWAERILASIDPRRVDAVGLHPYGHPHLIAFSELTGIWIDKFRETLGDKPLVVGEFGVGPEHGDAARANWLSAAYRSAHDQGFQMVTYFNDSTWRVNEGTETWAALQKGMRLIGGDPPGNF